MVELRTATLDDAEIMGRTMQAADRREALRLGMGALDGALRSVTVSVWSRAALVDGQLAALWGVAGVVLGPTGRPWLLTAPPLRHVPALTVARVYRQEAAHMLASFSTLENFVDCKYRAAIRLLTLAGFRLDEPSPHGPRGALFRRFWMGAPR